jgi:CheY-like chemotaxis protein
MPHVDGRKVTASIKALSPATPVIMLTGWGQHIADENSVPPGVDLLIAKPPRLQALRDVLARCRPATLNAAG